MMKARMLVLALLMMVPPVCFAQGYWAQLGDMPEIRYGHTVNELNGKIYVVGGVNTEGSVSPTTALVYDTLSGIWTQIPLYNNKARGAHGSVVVGGRLYVVGGQDSSGSLATMEMFDPSSGQWVSKNPMPTDRSLAACVSIEGKIYVIGGARFEGTNYNYIGLKTVEVYDTSSGTWTQSANMLTGRWGHSATAVNGKIYVFGGATILGSWNVYSSEVYNPQTNTWTTISNMPTARYCLTTCSLESNIYTIGGWYNSSSGPIYDKVEVYDPERDTWFTETPMPVKRAVLASTVVDGKIYVYGGARTTHPNIGTSGIYEFDRNPWYAHDVQLTRLAKDSLQITARTHDQLLHTLKVIAVLRDEAGVLIDSLSLKDDGLHGDGAAGDGLWGYQYSPPRDAIMHVSVRTDDLTAGTSRTLPDAASIEFTRKALITMDTRTVNLGRISVGTSHYDTSFAVQNIGYTTDSLTVSVDPVNVTPDTAVSAYPKMFMLVPGDSQKVTFSIRPGLLSSAYYAPQVIVQSKFAFGQTEFKKTYQFQVVVSSVSDNTGLPTTYTLDQNYPNPFNPTTTITYGLPRQSQVSLKVYNTLGQHISTLVQGDQEAGYHEVRFDASGLSSGVYFYRLSAGTFVETRKLLVLR